MTLAAVRRHLRDRRLHDVLGVVVTLALLELVVFSGYLSGGMIAAPDDFIGPVSNEPWAWWRDAWSGGSSGWMPYAWGGYPAAASLHNGAWYLPIGLATLLGPYTIHAAAVLQALTVAFGALGAYVLGRAWRLHHLASMLGLVAWFFAVGAYSSALQSDVVRGFAFAPWLLLCVSPGFPWRRWWSVPVAGVVVWQAAMGADLGVLAALACCCAAAVVAFQVVGRPSLREYLLPLGLSLAGAVLLSAPKFVSVWQLRGTISEAVPAERVLTPGMLGTLFFPYDFAWLPNDLSTRSLFVVAPCWVLLALVRRGSVRLLTPVLALGVTALVLGVLPLGGPWTADVRAPLVLAAVVAAMIAASGVLRAPAAPGRRAQVVRLGLVGSVPAGALAVALTTGFPATAWATPATLMLASAVLVAVLGTLTGPLTRSEPARQRVAAVALVLVAAASGVDWAYSTTAPWLQERVPIERAAWGASSGDLIAARQEATVVRRPARTPLSDATAPPNDVHWNSSYYTGQDAVGGYVDLAGSPAFTASLLATTSSDPETYLASRSLLAAPGLVIAVQNDTDLPTQEQTESCVRTGACGSGLQVTPLTYEPGELRYHVETDRASTVLLNEAFYPGWHVEACRPGSSYCRDLPARLGPAGMVLGDLPVGGAWDVSLTYTPPGTVRGTALALAGLGVLVLPVARRRFRRHPTPAAPS